MKKRISIIFLIIVLILGMNISNAAGIGVSGDTVTCYSGDTISLKFTTSGVSSTNQISAVEGQLGSLPSGITVSSITTSLSNNVPGGNSISATNGGAAVSSNVTITVKLNVASSVSVGTYTIPMFVSVMDYENGISVYDGNVNGTVKVISKETSNTNTNTNPGTIKSSDANLKSLTATADGNALGITKESTKYMATVESTVNKITFNVIANSSIATIDTSSTTTGVKLSLNSKSAGQKTYTLSDLKEGNNVARITITAEDGTQKNYTFVVTKKVNGNTTGETIIPNVVDNTVNNTTGETGNGNTTVEETPTLGLKNLVITGVEISPAFDSKIYQYTATIGKDEAVEVITTPTIEGSTVEVVGNTNLVVGENIITILVKNGDETVTYQVVLTKSEVQEVSTENTSNALSVQNITWKHIVVIGLAAIIAVLIIAKLISMSKKNINENGEVEEQAINEKPKGRRYR